MDSWTIYLESVDKYKKSDVATCTSNRFYSFKNLNEEIIRVETGIPIK